MNALVRRRLYSGLRIKTMMPTVETNSEPLDTAATTSGWDVATGEYVERETRSDGGDACKARWRGIKGLDAEC